MSVVLDVKDLVVDFKTRAGNARVLNQVSLDLREGEILGIVGESGCGKSMTALSIMGLIPNPPGRITSGSISLDGQELTSMPAAKLRAIRGNRISMIFQEPMTSLNPVFRIGDQISESVLLHQNVSKKEAWKRAVEMLELVGIPEPAVRARSYPHELSGGMRQRVMIGLALACKPKVLIADEPTTALDVTVQAQIFDLLKNLQEETGTAIILITHDMGAVAELADRVSVMYAGHVIETGSTRQILDDPRHPYTRGLISCVPHLEDNPGDERPYLEEIEGVVPPLTELGTGCAFAPRCKHVMDRCLTTNPVIGRVSQQHSVACHLLKEKELA
ncbi:ABC transporter ATP-binding protein [Sneathiella glossodoripedis]|uniref:ABC transporter ATP-binding protein n=1 Tax=Sneathiella glossodoripedis TaxID=418853 RepID=UPI00047004CC|nr:ABC transporter ATP-binding protein [Sneathiella glossodoripedis]